MKAKGIKIDRKAGKSMWQRQQEAAAAQRRRDEEEAAKARDAIRANVEAEAAEMKAKGGFIT